MKVSSQCVEFDVKLYSVCLSHIKVIDQGQGHKNKKVYLWFYASYSGSNI